MRLILAWLAPLLQVVLLVGCVMGIGDPLYTLPAAVDVVLRIAGGLALISVLPSLLSLGPALSPLPIPREDGALATTGIYGVVRHPVYVGLVLGGSLLAIANGRLSCLVSAALLLLLLDAKARWEERMLKERFPDYAAYARRVPRWIPRLRASQ